MKHMKAAAVVLGLLSVLAAGFGAGPEAAPRGIRAAILVSADAEWAVVRTLFPAARYDASPFGEFIVRDIALTDARTSRVVIFHGGWGKVAAAASTQYVIDRWDPAVLVNLGTCGGFERAVARFDIVLATKTVIYDIVERMGNPEGAVADYITEIDLGWLRGPDPPGVRRGVIVSADQDAAPDAGAMLGPKYGAAAVDWESGAIAYTASRNKKRVLILRGVTDLVGPRGDETYGHIEIFLRNAEVVMKRLFAELPRWLSRIPDERECRRGDSNPYSRINGN
jgi:adenosylhomocysteine nucleosidase